MTDVQQIALYRADESYGATLVVGCSSSVPWLNMRVADERFWPGVGDEFYVSTRFDQLPAETMQTWTGGRGYTLMPSADVPAFIKSMASHQQLLVRVGSRTMRQSADAAFPLAGFEPAYRRFMAACARIQPPPDPPTAG